jgi:hypothetical protein
MKRAIPITFTILPKGRQDEMKVFQGVFPTLPLGIQGLNNLN